jgi:hypothetical protein
MVHDGEYSEPRRATLLACQIVREPARGTCPTYRPLARNRASQGNFTRGFSREFGLNDVFGLGHGQQA